MNAFRKWGLLAGAVLALVAVAGCDSITGESDDDSSASPLKLTGTSGNDVSMNGTWDRGCTPGDWGSNNSIYKMDGGKWSIVGTDYTGADCDAGTEVVESKAAATIADDDVLVTISDWVDGSGAVDVAPTGLEDVTDANGVTWDISSATFEPLTAAAADELNAMDAGAGYCGETDWAAGEAQDVVVCWFGSANPDPAQSSILLDDTTVDGEVSWYESPDEATVLDADGYPTEIQNFDPVVK